MKKIIPSICMLLVTAVLMGTSTYAWFSMNKTVTATGMKVSASTSANLIISANEITKFDSTNNDYNLDFKDTGFTALTPVSSADGIKFFTASKPAAKPNDEALETGASFVAQSTATVSGSGSSTTTYWVTKTAHIGVKGVTNLGALSVNVTVNTNKKDSVTVTEDAKKIYKALRFAVIYNDNDAVIFSGDLAESKTARTWNGAIAALDVAASGATKEVSTVIASTKINGIDTLEAAKDYEITIVVWLEGQDEACFADNTNAAAAIFNGLDVSFTFTAA